MLRHDTGRRTQLALSFARLALQTAQEALAQAEKSGAARSTVASAARRLARLLRMRFSDYQPAMEAARLALAHLPAAKPEELTRAAAKLESLQTQARKLEGKALAALKPRLAAASAERQSLAQTLEDRLGALLEISRIESARGDYTRALEQAEQALTLARASGLPLQDAPLLEVVNNLYYTGRYAQALESADQGLKQAGKNELRQIEFYNAKGTVYAALGRTAEALAALEQALRMAQRLKNPGEIAASHNNLGNALRLAGRFPEAKERFAQALAIDRQQKDRLGLAFDLANLGLTEELLGRTRDARASLEQALRLSPTATAYIVERKGPTDAAFAALTPASGTIQTKYDDTAIAPQTSYTYRVLPIGVGGSGVPSNYVTVLSPPPMDTVPPVARITSPTNGAVVSGPVIVSATASDNVGLRGIEIHYLPSQASEVLCGKAYSTLQPSDTLSCTWDPRYLPPGTAATLTRMPTMISAIT